MHWRNDFILPEVVENIEFGLNGGKRGAGGVRQEENWLPHASCKYAYNNEERKKNATALNIQCMHEECTLSKCYRAYMTVT